MGESQEDALPVDEQAFLDHRKRLDELRIDQLTAFDKALLTLSTGAIGLSLLVLQWISQRHEPQSVMVLVLSWIAFLVAILLNLASYQTSAVDVGREIAKIDADLIAGRRISEDGNIFRSLTTILNWLCLGSFALGTLCFFLFAYQNATGGT